MYPIARCVKAISILAPTRGATQICRQHSGNGHNFNPRSHEGSDHPTLQRIDAGLYFNPRSHEGSDNRLCGDPNIIFCISILAPTRGATIANCITAKYDCDFNPRSHEGSDANGCRRISDYGAFQSSLPRGERRLSRSPL